MNPVDDEVAYPQPELVDAADAAPSRHRSHLHPGRQRAVLVRYDDDEYGDVTRAAAQAGLTPTGFVASAALAVARIVASSGDPSRGRE